MVERRLVKHLTEEEYAKLNDVESRRKALGCAIAGEQRILADLNSRIKQAADDGENLSPADHRQIESVRTISRGKVEDWRLKKYKLDTEYRRLMDENIKRAKQSPERPLSQRRFVQYAMTMKLLREYEDLERQGVLTVLVESVIESIREIILAGRPAQEKPEVVS